MIIEQAAENDAELILNLQKIVYRSETKSQFELTLPPLMQTIDEILDDFKNQTVLKASIDGEIAGSVRAYTSNGTCFIDRLVVHPRHRNKGIGTELLNHIEEFFSQAKRFELYAWQESTKILYLYTKSGYIVFDVKKNLSWHTVLYLEKYRLNKEQQINRLSTQTGRGNAFSIDKETVSDNKTRRRNAVALVDKIQSHKFSPKEHPSHSFKSEPSKAPEMSPQDIYDLLKTIFPGSTITYSKTYPVKIRMKKGLWKSASFNVHRNYKDEIELSDVTFKMPGLISHIITFVFTMLLFTTIAIKFSSVSKVTTLTGITVGVIPGIIVWPFIDRSITALVRMSWAPGLKKIFSIKPHVSYELFPDWNKTMVVEEPWPLWAKIIVASGFILMAGFMIISTYIGGGSLGICPSKDGYIVTSHGIKTVVSQGVWAFALLFETFIMPFYSFMFLFLFSRNVKQMDLDEKKEIFFFLVFSLFASTIFILATLSTISKFITSYNDWILFK